MGMFSGVLLATDYDDTLYDSTGAISQENRQAIARFVAEGGRFCISTGRSYINFAIQMERERLPVNAPVILSNGASIYDFARQESLWLKFLPQQAPLHLAQVCAAFPQAGFEAYHQRSTPSGPTSSPSGTWSDAASPAAPGRSSRCPCRGSRSSFSTRTRPIWNRSSATSWPSGRPCTT